MIGGRLRKALTISASALVLVAVATAVELAVLRLEAMSWSVRLIFLVALNLNVAALLMLVYYVLRQIYALYIERRRGILGYKFRTKVVAFFLILVSIPSLLLFVIASELGTNYIDRFFAPQFRRPIESSLEVARGFYDVELRRAMDFAELAAKGLDIPGLYRVSYAAGPSEDDSAAVSSAFDGTPETEVISSSEGDLVRAALPLEPGDPRGRVLVVDTTLPQDITANIDRIMTAYEDYVHLEAWRFPIKLNYLLLLGFFTLIVIFAALWVSLKIASWITEPVRSLAYATEEVAQGNLDVRVISTRKDETGMLIESFNNMVREMRQDKESLKKAYQNLENIVKNIQSGVISLDKKGTVQDINEAACRILNVKAENLIGRPYHVILSGISSPDLKELVKGINLRTFREVDREIRATVEGRKMLIRVYITALLGLDGEHTGMLVVLDNITELIKAQRALAWQEVARRIAHEIKNPLTPIRLSTERMLKKWQSGDPGFDTIFERSTKAIIREVDSLKRLVDEFSRLGKMPEIIKAPTNVLALANDVAGLYRDHKGLSIHVEAQTGLEPVSLDQEQFRRVLINLVENAAEAMRNKGRIELRLSQSPEDNKFQLVVADQGPGIRDEDRERLFLPYFSTKKDGTGLGLAIADKIVAEHGGSIRVRDNEPQGSVFTIEMPIKET